MISWSTDAAASSLVEYGVTATALLKTATVSGFRLSHTVSLTGLNPGTTYFYRVTSADMAGTCAIIASRASHGQLHDTR